MWWVIVSVEILVGIIPYGNLILVYVCNCIECTFHQWQHFCDLWWSFVTLFFNKFSNWKAKQFPTNSSVIGHKNMGKNWYISWSICNFHDKTDLLDNVMLSWGLGNWCVAKGNLLVGLKVAESCSISFEDVCFIRLYPLRWLPLAIQFKHSVVVYTNLFIQLQQLAFCWYLRKPKVTFLWPCNVNDKPMIKCATTPWCTTIKAWVVVYCTPVEDLIALNWFQQAT